MNLSIKNNIIKDSESNGNIYKYYIIYTPMHSLYFCGVNSLEDIKSFCKGKILRIFAIKNENNHFSDEDIRIAEESNYPISSYSLIDKSTIEYIPKKYSVNLEGEEYILGERDCYEIVRIYFRQNFNIYLKDHDRDESFHTSKKDSITESLKDYPAFKVITDRTSIQKNDILVFNSRMAHPQHFQIFMGNSRGLHHPLGKLSKIDIIQDYTKLKYILRYVG